MILIAVIFFGDSIPLFVRTCYKHVALVLWTIMRPRKRNLVHNSCILNKNRTHLLANFVRYILFFDPFGCPALYSPWIGVIRYSISIDPWRPRIKSSEVALQ